MPSLKELEQFKTSFYDIANEKENVTSRNLPFNDFELPKNEAPPFDYLRPSGNGAPTGDFDFSALVNDVPGGTAADPFDDVLSGLGAASPEADTSILDDFFKDIGIGGDAPKESEQTDEEAASFLADILGGSQTDAEVPISINEEPQQNKVIEIDEGSIPDDLLAGFSDEMESASSDFQSADFQSGDFQSADFQSGDFSTGIEDTTDSKSDDFGIDDFGLDVPLPDFSAPDGQDDSEFADESKTDDLDNIEPGYIDMGGESRNGLPQNIDNISEIEDTLDDFSDTFDDFANSEFTPDADDTFDTGKDSFDMGGESGSSIADDFGGIDGSDDFSSDFSSDASSDFSSDDSGTTEIEDTDFDSPLSEIEDTYMDFSEIGNTMDSALDGFDPGSDSDISFGSGDLPGQVDDFSSDFSSDTLDIDTTAGDTSSHTAADDSHHDFGGDEFHIPGLDDIFDKSKSNVQVDVPEKKGLFGFGRRKKKKAEEVPEAGDVEEISLSQDDVNNLLQTLNSYPLNLRIVCEEIIAEQVILPQLLSKLIRLLVNGAHVKETAAHVEQITGNKIVIPKSFEKSTGAAFEEEQASFAYIFVHNFLPVLKLFAVIAALVGSVFYLSYKFIYIPLAAESLYKRGYERISAGEYQRANDLFHQGFSLHKKKKWFYTYAEAFRDLRHFQLAAGKYDELLRHYPRDKKGVLDYAAMHTYYTFNFDNANRLLQRELLDFAPNDYHGLLAAGDNFLAWGDSDPSRFFDRYEDARFSYARLMEVHGEQAPIMERMMKYFIRTDDLFQVLNSRAWFEAIEKRKLSTESLAELGGYLLDKQLETPRGVPSPYIESIESVRAMLLQAVGEDPYLPEPHYHLARYHKNLGNTYEERMTLENAIRAFNLAKTESVRRRLYRIDTHYRYAELLTNNREFFPAEEQLITGINLYRESIARNLLRESPDLGRLYAAKGDLEFYTKTGDSQAASNALTDYHRAEETGYAPPEMLYRMGAAYYQLEEWGNSLSYLSKASADLPLNRRMLYALGNAAYQRGDYFVAQGYYNRLLDILENQRIRLPVLLPNDNPVFLELGERLMMAFNNSGAAYEALSEQTGNREYRSRALSLYAESSRAWDSITRNPSTMVRMRISEIPGAPGINLGYLNAANALSISSTQKPRVFIRIDRDVIEPSRWEQLAPFSGM